MIKKLDAINVTIFANSCWTVFNFRANLVKALKARGCRVTVIAADDSYKEQLNNLGCDFIPLNIKSRGKNIFKEFCTLAATYTAIKRLSPDVLLTFTIKPNIYGSLLAPLIGCKVINNITGLGSIFSSDNYLTKIIRFLYKIAFIKSSTVFFQNNEDMQLFLKYRLIRKSQCERLPGSGVNLEQFKYAPASNSYGRSFRFILIARMLWDKGIAEYVDASRNLKIKFPNTEFWLVGFLDAENPASISASQMNELTADGVVSYRGGSRDILSEILMADCIVLPSYYKEGVPRSLLEAAAVGRPIITTNMPGCRDVVDDGINGFLCSARDSNDLAKKMEKILMLPVSDRLIMGLSSRRKMELCFDEKVVIDQYIKYISKALEISKV